MKKIASLFLLLLVGVILLVAGVWPWGEDELAATNNPSRGDAIAAADQQPGEPQVERTQVSGDDPVTRPSTPRVSGCLIEESGDGLQAAGVISFRSRNSEGVAQSIEVAVENGRFWCDTEDFPKPGVEAAAFLFQEGGGLHSRPVDVRWKGEKSEVELIFADSWELSYWITNLRGDPIPGAHLQVGAPVPQAIRESAVSDEEGLIQVRVRSAEPSLRVRVVKDGYVGQSFEVSRAEGSAVQEIRLQRFLGVAIAEDLRFKAWTASLFDDATVFASGADWLHLTKPMEAEAGLRGYEIVQWDVYGEGEKWVDAETVKVSVFVFDEWVGTFDAPLRHITDPEFKVHRIPGEFLADLDQLVPVDLRVAPRAAFLAPAPSTLGMSFRALEGEMPEFVAKPRGSRPGDENPWYGTRGVHVDGEVYRFHLPPGRFEVRSVPSSGGMTGNTPVFLPGQAVEVVEGVGVQALQLHPDERYGEVVPVDRHGHRVDVAMALTVEQKEQPTFWPARAVFPWRQWFRPGSYEVWGMEMSTAGTIRLASFEWPPAGDAGLSHEVEIDFNALGVPASELR